MRRIIAMGAAIAAMVAPLLVRADGHQPAWLAGDFHVHTTYSHDSWDPEGDDEESEPYTLGHSVANQFAIAASRWLDFIAITDHNDIRSQADPDFGSNGVLGVRAYEKSLSGHAQMLGATACYAPEGTTPGPMDCSGWSDKSAARVNQIANLLRGDGGVFQINHPAGGSVDFPNDSDWGYGHEVVPDTVEVWNIQSVWQAPAFSSNSLDDAIRFWEDFLDAGHRVAATGGSDNHWVSTTAAQGVGQPTTWVYAAERTEAAILDALRAGRTTISWQPPRHYGPRLFLEADGDADGELEAMIGDEVPAGTPIFGRTTDAPAGSFVEFITSTRRVIVPAVTAAGGVGFLPDAGERWVRAELFVPDHTGNAVAGSCDEVIGGSSTYCRNRLVRLAMTSPIYLSAD